MHQIIYEIKTKINFNYLQCRLYIITGTGLWEELYYIYMNFHVFIKKTRLISHLFCIYIKFIEEFLSLSFTF